MAKNVFDHIYSFMIKKRRWKFIQAISNLKVSLFFFIKFLFVFHTSIFRKFQTIAYSVDGEHLLAAGDSKYICLYSVPDCLLLKRFEVTCNLSLDGVQEMHDHRHYLGQLSIAAREAKAAERPSLPIPKSRHGVDKSLRQWRPEVKVSSLQFSPTGKLILKN